VVKLVQQVKGQDRFSARPQHTIDFVKIKDCVVLVHVGPYGESGDDVDAFIRDLPFHLSSILIGREQGVTDIEMDE
jgi:hypothetical protein